MSKIKKVESTDLVTVTPEEQAYLDAIKAEQYGGNSGEGPKLQKLVINMKSKDDDGVKRIIGSWHITGTDKYYDGEIKFRPIRFVNKLLKYVQDSSKNWVIDGETVYFKEFSETIYDTNGGIALGRIFGKQYSEEQKKKAREASKAEVYCDIFGLVQLGDEEWHPVVYRVRGVKFRNMMDAFKAIPKDKIYSEYAYTMETKQADVGTYWDVVVSPDLSKRLRISDIMEMDKQIIAFIGDSNRKIMAEHAKKTTENGVATRFADKTITIEVDELDDELPF